MSEILDYGKDAAGNKVVRGKFLVDPSGSLVLAQAWAAIKFGWRLATQADVDAHRAKSEPAIEPAPLPEPEIDEPTRFLGRESLDSDAVELPDGPRYERKDD